MYKLSQSSDYKTFIEQNKYYVDKTMLIEEILDAAEVVLITRPRRFGKTLNLSMLKYFFELGESNDHLFLGKKIYLSQTYKNHINKYPVIFITLKDLKGISWDEDYKKIKNIFYDTYNRYNFLLTSNNLNIYEKKDIENVLYKKDDVDYSSYIKNLCTYLYKHYNKKVIVLMDEYDSLVSKNLDEEHYKRCISFLRNLISSTFKGNDYLEKGVLTGILRIAKEDLFSGANNIISRSILDDDFSDKFGFTEEETLKLLDDFSIKNKAQEVKDWYNGYSFGRFNKVVIYNPFSITNYVQEKVLKNYWINTGDNNLIKNLLIKSNDSIKNYLDLLMKGESIDVSVEETISMADLRTTDSIWSLLLFSGYLKPIDYINNNYKLKLVNREIRSSFVDLIKKYFKETVRPSSKILEAISNEDILSLKEELERILLSTVSSNDLINENSYHMLFKGICYCLESEYTSSSNFESGKGRYDLEIEPLDKTKAGYIIEIKHTRDKEKLEKLAKEAIEQIKDNKYITNIKNKGTSRVIIIGIACCKKEIFLQHEVIC